MHRIFLLGMPSIGCGGTLVELFALRLQLFCSFSFFFEVRRVTSLHLLGSQLSVSSNMSAPPPSDQMRASGSGRRKVALPAGRSQLDWVRNSARIIPQRPRSITREELRKHRSKNDVWMAIESQVYDVTPYVEYHPGGVPMIIAGAGKVRTNSMCS